MTTRTHLARQEEAQTETGVQARAADPGGPTTGQLWLNTTSYVMKYKAAGGVVTLGGGGGGGGSLQWIEDANAPLPAIENAQRIYMFQAVLGQAIYCAIKVPASYPGGTQINLKTLFYSPDSSGNVLIKTVTTLIRAATDAITSTTNQRTSTNAALTLGAGTVNKPQAVTCDLTDSTGNINSVAVSAGDIILVALQRSTGDTATSDAKLLPYATEVTFQ